MRSVLSQVRHGLALCAEQGIHVDRWGYKQWADAHYLPDAGVPRVVAVWLKKVAACVAEQTIERAIRGAGDDPVFGYFDPTVVVSSQSRFVSNSGYWLAQARYLERFAVQNHSVLGSVVFVGQCLDHAGIWPFLASVLAGVPVMWLPPPLLFSPSMHDKFGLPTLLVDFLFLDRERVDPTGGRRVNTALCFIPELCFAQLNMDQRLRRVAIGLQQWSRVVLMGEGRLCVPAQRSPRSDQSLPILLAVSEREAVTVGDKDSYVGRVPLGFVRPAILDGDAAIHDTLILESLLPQVNASASGSQVGSLTYCRSTLRIDVEGMWLSSRSRTNDRAKRRSSSKDETNKCPQSLRAKGMPPRLRWELAVHVVLRDRANPIIEPEDASFRPSGAWEAPCRFWERFVQWRMPISCWIKIRPESEAEGLCSIRLAPHYLNGLLAVFLDHVRTFAELAPWARFYCLSDTHWTAGVAPRWDEIFGHCPTITRTSFSPLKTTTFTRLVARVLGLSGVPQVSQTWSELGGDWFDLCRLTRLLQGMGWSWRMPIYALQQPVGRLALQLTHDTIPNQVEQNSVTSSVPSSEMSRRIVPLSVYHLGLLRRYRVALPQYVRCLQFSTSETVSVERVGAALAVWVDRFSVLASQFEHTEHGLQHVFFPVGGESNAVLSRRALDFRDIPFLSAFLEKQTLENCARDLEMSDAPPWRCLIYPKHQGRWFAWVFAHRLLFDMSEWLDSTRCLQALLSEMQDLSSEKQMKMLLQNVPASALPWALRQQNPLPAVVLEQCAYFWQERLEWRATRLFEGVSAEDDTDAMRDGFKSCVQTLPWPINGSLWRMALANGNIDSLTLILWAVVKALSESRDQTPLCLDLEVPWTPLNGVDQHKGSRQFGIVPLFLSLHNWSQRQGDPGLGLSALKQQLYTTLMAPHPDHLLLSGKAMYEQLYDALYKQEVCFTYFNALSESRDLSPLADAEQLHRFAPGEFLNRHTAYALKIEAMPRRGHFVLVWTYNENLLHRDTVNRLSTQALSLLSRVLGVLVSVQELGKRADRHHMHRAVPLCPVDFGIEGVSDSDWSCLVADFPEMREVWAPLGVSACIFENQLKSPLTLTRGSQAIRCAFSSVTAFRKRVEALSSWVPHIASRWAVLPEGAVLLVTDSPRNVCVREVLDRQTWEKPVMPRSCLDEQNRPIPCIFVFLSGSNGQGLVRCDYDVRALEPILVSAVLVALSEGTMGPIKNAMSALWSACPGELSQFSYGKSSVMTSKSNGFALSSALPCDFDKACRAYWTLRFQKQFQKDTDEVPFGSWLPITELVDYTEQAPSPLLRHTTLDSLVGASDVAADTSERDALIRVLQTIRRNVVRLWGERHWVVKVVFADRHALAESGMGAVWAESVATTPHCWLPVLLGTGRESHDDTGWFDTQLCQSAQYPPNSEAQLLEWLDRPSRHHLTDIVLLVVSGEKGAAALVDWHRIQLAPFQFQWNPAHPAEVRLSAHVALGIATAQTGRGAVIATPTDQVVAQALWFPGVKSAMVHQIPRDVLRRVDQEQDDAVGADALTQHGVGAVMVLDIVPTEIPKSTEAFTVELSNYLSERLVLDLLPDVIRVCREDEWGIEACTKWLQDAHARFQEMVERQLSPVWWQPENESWSSGMSSARRGDLQFWFQAVSGALPGWPAALRCASLLSPQSRISEKGFSTRAVRNLLHWSQWFGWRGTVPDYMNSTRDERWELTPDQACWLAMEWCYPSHFNVSALLELKADSVDALMRAVRAVVLADPIFRLQFMVIYDEGGERITLSNRPQQSFSHCSDETLIDAVMHRVSFSSRNIEQTLESIRGVAATWQGQFDLLRAPLVRFIIFDGGEKSTSFVLIMGHRFVIDIGGIHHLAQRLEAHLKGRTVKPMRTWRHWLAFLAQQRAHVRQLPPVSHGYASQIRRSEERLSERICRALDITMERLRSSVFQNRAVRRQFLGAVSEAQGIRFCQGKPGPQDPRTGLCLATLALAVSSWVGSDEMVIGQQWPIRCDPRARHWSDVIGAFEFVFKNQITLIDDSPLATAEQLIQVIPETLQNAIFDAFMHDHFDVLDAFNLISFERIDQPYREWSGERLQPVSLPLGMDEHGENYRRSFIRLEAAFGAGGLELRWIYDSHLLHASRLEGLIAHFAYYWKKLQNELKNQVSL
ncbi:MAG: hypothetical protein P8144_02320 [Gammaproteobacteria bacterium]